MTVLTDLAVLARMRDLFALLESVEADSCVLLSDRDSRLRAVLVLDDLTLGPAAGGVRTASYTSVEEAIRDAAALARAMTLKCALADLGAGGGKIVVLDHPGMDRERAFEALGNHIERLNGLFRTAGDYGTTQADLRAMARRTRYVQSEEDKLGRSVALGVLRCMEAVQTFRGSAASVAGLRIAVQGCGVIGASVTKLLAENDAELVISDLVRDRAEAVAHETGADILGPEELLHAEVDIFAPCAQGNWLDREHARHLAARAVCGAANNVLVDVGAARVLKERDIVHVPDAIASAGAVIEGVGRTVMGLPDRTPLIDHLGRTTIAVLEDAHARGITPFEAAIELAERRLDEARART